MACGTSGKLKVVLVGQSGLHGIPRLRHTTETLETQQPHTECRSNMVSFGVFDDSMLREKECDLVDNVDGKLIVWHDLIAASSDGNRSSEIV
jgi:hypothetical protein